MWNYQVWDHFHLNILYSQHSCEVSVKSFVVIKFAQLYFCHAMSCDAVSIKRKSRILICDRKDASDLLYLLTWILCDEKIKVNHCLNRNVCCFQRKLEWVCKAGFEIFSRRQTIRVEGDRVIQSLWQTEGGVCAMGCGGMIHNIVHVCALLCMCVHIEACGNAVWIVFIVRSFCQGFWCCLRDALKKVVSGLGLQ